VDLAINQLLDLAVDGLGAAVCVYQPDVAAAARAEDRDLRGQRGAPNPDGVLALGAIHVEVEVVHDPIVLLGRCQPWWARWLPGRPVDLAHEAAMGLAGRSELLVAFLKGVLEIEDLLAQALEFRASVSRVQRAEAGAFRGVRAEQLGQPRFQVGNALLEPLGVPAQVDVVG
jgi:hypothetical protein